MLTSGCEIIHHEAEAFTECIFHDISDAAVDAYMNWFEALVQRHQGGAGVPEPVRVLYDVRPAGLFTTVHASRRYEAIVARYERLPQGRRAYLVRDLNEAFGDDPERAFFTERAAALAWLRRSPTH